MVNLNNIFQGIRRLSVIVCCLSFIPVASCHATSKNTYVTYESSGGRFGDQLISYLHAKWISYKYDIPVLYRPFPYSEHLKVDELEEIYRYEDLVRFRLKKRLGKSQALQHLMSPVKNDTLYIIPYFPESLWEHENHGHFNSWPYFAVDWEDKNFRKLLQKFVQPKQPLKLLELPNDIFTVCAHVRRGKDSDGVGMERHYPMKFPPDEFYIEQILSLYEYLGQLPLYVHIFTDDSDSADLLERFESAFRGKSITCATRTSGNHHTLNVLEDFFSLMKFDCIIYSESNFSLCAALIGDHCIKIRPKVCDWRGGKLYIDVAEKIVDKDMLIKRLDELIEIENGNISYE
ncbi:MAG: hypothetical protein S4CHLAM102_07490 [Chlamydiia bacterium]|nr:hypothetical protein [Chlamydiia bacterium]